MSLSSIVSKASEKLSSGFKKSVLYTSAFLMLNTSALASCASYTKIGDDPVKTTKIIENPQDIRSYNDKRVEFDAVPINTSYAGNSFLIDLEVRDENNNTLYNIRAREDVHKSNQELIEDINHMLSSNEKDNEGIIEYNKNNPAWDEDIKITVSGMYDHRGKEGFYEKGHLELETITMFDERYFTDPETSSIYKEHSKTIFVPEQVYVRVHYPRTVRPSWDMDGDGIPDWWQHHYRYDWNSRWADPDGDGLPNWMEWRLGTDPFNPDTDFDGLSDYYEWRVGLNPLNPDTDFDGIPDYYDRYPKWNNNLIIVTTPFLHWHSHWFNFYMHWDLWGHGRWCYPHYYYPKKEVIKGFHHKYRDRDQTIRNMGGREYKERILRDRDNIIGRTKLNDFEREKFKDFKIDDREQIREREKVRKLEETYRERKDYKSRTDDSRKVIRPRDNTREKGLEERIRRTPETEKKKEETRTKEYVPPKRETEIRRETERDRNYTPPRKVEPPRQYTPPKREETPKRVNPPKQYTPPKREEAPKKVTPPRNDTRRPEVKRETQRNTTPPRQNTNPPQRNTEKRSTDRR